MARVGEFELRGRRETIQGVVGILAAIHRDEDTHRTTPATVSVRLFQSQVDDIGKRQRRDPHAS
jgi:hypothetical protein